MANRLRVETYNLTTGELATSKLIDFSADGFDWLRRNVIWAANHKHGVQVFNADDNREANTND